MTKVQNPIIGRARASAGGMTFTKNYDKNVMRSKPFEVKNPKTAAQVKQRDFFKQVQGVVATVSDEQLRTLFPNMPKAMSRRNALSKQIAEYYIVDGTNKSIDFANIDTIGNAPVMDFGETSVAPDTDGVIVAVSNNLSLNPTLKDFYFIAAVVNVTKKQIYLGLTTDTAENSEITVPYQNGWDENDTYTAIPLLTNSTEDVSTKGFGSFSIKFRPEKKSANAQSDQPKPGDVITVNGKEAGDEVSLDFSNYDFNNLLPGDLVEMSGDEKLVLVESQDWIEGANNIWTATLENGITDSDNIYLHINQAGSDVDKVKFAVVVTD